MSDPKDTYQFEPERHAPTGETPMMPGASTPRAGRPIDASAPASDAGSSPASRPEPVRLEEENELPPALQPVKALDVCPNCGAPMGSADEIVCLRCGFLSKADIPSLQSRRGGPVRRCPWCRPRYETAIYLRHILPGGPIRVCPRCGSRSETTMSLLQSRRGGPIRFCPWCCFPSWNGISFATESMGRSGPTLSVVWLPF